LVNGRNIILITFFVLSAITVYCLSLGVETANIKLFLRITGRLAMLLFILSFGARPLHAILKTRFTAYLMQNRRYLGLSTALILVIHLGGIGLFALENSVLFEAEAPWYILAPGALVYLLVILMAVTSTNIAQKKLGMYKWKLLHTVGGYSALGAFVYEYVLIVLKPDYPDSMVFPALAYVLFICTWGFLGLRIYTQQKLPTRKPST